MFYTSICPSCVQMPTVAKEVIKSSGTRVKYGCGYHVFEKQTQILYKSSEFSEILKSLSSSKILF